MAEFGHGRRARLPRLRPHDGLLLASTFPSSVGPNLKGPAPHTVTARANGERKMSAKGLFQGLMASCTAGRTERCGRDRLESSDRRW